jgi:hypothetical protein
VLNKIEKVLPLSTQLFNITEVIYRNRYGTVFAEGLIIQTDFSSGAVSSFPDSRGGEWKRSSAEQRTPVERRWRDTDEKQKERHGKIP